MYFVLLSIFCMSEVFFHVGIIQRVHSLLVHSCLFLSLALHSGVSFHTIRKFIVISGYESKYPPGIRDMDTRSLLRARILWVVINFWKAASSKTFPYWYHKRAFTHSKCFTLYKIIIFIFTDLDCLNTTEFFLRLWPLKGSNKWYRLLGCSTPMFEYLMVI